MVSVPCVTTAPAALELTSRRLSPASSMTSAISSDAPGTSRTSWTWRSVPVSVRPGTGARNCSPEYPCFPTEIGIRETLHATDLARLTVSDSDDTHREGPCWHLRSEADSAAHCSGTVLSLVACGTRRPQWRLLPGAISDARRKTWAGSPISWAKGVTSYGGDAKWTRLTAAHDGCCSRRRAFADRLRLGRNQSGRSLRAWSATWPRRVYADSSASARTYRAAGRRLRDYP